MLAVVDTHFPWSLYGFRYWENYEFHKIDKNILFFSVHKMNDYFPTRVHTLSAMKKYPISDIYCAFLNHTLGVLDCPLEIPGKQNYGLSRFIVDKNISIHTTIYPGGGFEENFKNQAIEGLKFLKEHPNLENVFTNLSEVMKVIPKAYRIVNGNTNTDFYTFTPRNKSGRLQLLFAATYREEKGFKYMAKAFNALDPSKYHLHIVGNWNSELRWIKNSNYTFHGALPMDKLRQVYNQCHIVVNPSYRGQVPMYNTFLVNLGKLVPVRSRFLPTAVRPITLDGFPTVMCMDAMSTGCCLVSTNPRHDYFALKPEEDYVEIGEKSSEEIIDALEYLHYDQDKMLSIAKSGHLKMLRYCDTKKIVRFKYDIIRGEKGNQQSYFI